MSNAVPSWALSSSSALFGAAATGSSPKPSSTDSSVGITSTQLDSHKQEDKGRISSHSTAAFAGEAGHDASSISRSLPPPKRKQRPVTRCPPSSSSLPRHIDERDARSVLMQLIALQANRSGFDASTSSALHELAQLTERFVTGIFAAANHASELGGRNATSARDLIYSLETHGQSMSDLERFYRSQMAADAHDDRKSSQRARERARSQILVRPRPDVGEGEEEGNAWLDVGDSFLPSDSDDGSELDTWSMSSDSDSEHPSRRIAVEARVRRRKHNLSRIEAKMTRREERQASKDLASQHNANLALTSGEKAWHRVADHVIPRHLPGRPPRHSWLATPAYPTNTFAARSIPVSGAPQPSPGRADRTTRRTIHPMEQLNRKVANARLVENSLRKLIQATDSAAESASAEGSAKRRGVAEKV